jgi:hypothetical protein
MQPREGIAMPRAGMGSRPDVKIKHIDGIVVSS